MARFFGKVGFSQPGSLVDGVWTETNIIERDHKGRVLSAVRSLEPSDKVNDDYRLQNRISIVGDEYALEHLATIKYVLLRGTRWTVTSVELARPRLILALGEVYNGPHP